MQKILKAFGVGVASALVAWAMGNQSQVGLAQDCTINVQPGQQLFTTHFTGPFSFASAQLKIG